LAITLALSWLARRTDWEKVPALPLRRERRAGQIIRLAAAAYTSRPRALLTFGLVYLPAAALGAIIAGVIAVTPVIKDILGHTSGASGSDLFLSLIAGGIPNVLALVFVNGAMAVYLDRADTEDPLSPFDAVKLAWDRRRFLAVGLLRASVVVGLLLLTVVGTPWAIRQLIRYQLMPHAVMLEDLDGRAGLDRSSALTRGRWWHTALFLTILNLLLLGVSIGTGIVLLVLFAWIPLVLFSMVIMVLFAFVAPITAFALTLLYGDAVAENSGNGPADRAATDLEHSGVPVQ
jgi:hypothetical protein